MKKLIFGMGISVLVPVLFVSCEKETIQKVENHEHKKVDQIKNGNNFVNPQNDIGELHNTILEEIKQYSIDHDLVLDQEQSFSFIQDFLKSSGYENHLTFEQAHAEFENYNQKTFNDLLIEYKNNHKISELQYEYLVNLESGISESKNFGEFKNHLNDLNLAISIDYFATEDERQQLFRLTSIAEHSYKFWISTYNMYGNNLNKKGGKIFFTVLADVGGGLLCAPAGPGGAIAGATLFSLYTRCCIVGECSWISC
ncbi:MAG: hypothetical protein K0R65_984 [Crocinitomicaceae bacterium]|jgi:hypothetical protein|nr:hypothetical protein [Crocinitomicaceae bacterium]